MYSSMLLLVLVLMKVDSFLASEIVQFEEVGATLNEDCGKKPERGVCFGNFDRWYYNTKTNRCQKFRYSGCGGNGNRFLTWGQCNLECPYKKTFNTDCSGPKSVGYCYSQLRRWYYNTITEKCQRFYYSGCAGNKNRFSSKRECEENCPARRGCLEPSKRGPCKKYTTRFYFNRETKQCELFIYGGCQGNRNNFNTREECQNECPVEVRKGRKMSHADFDLTWF